MEEITKTDLIAAFTALAGAIGYLHHQFSKGHEEMNRRLIESEARCREELTVLRDRLIESQTALIEILERRIPHRQEIVDSLRTPDRRERAED